MTLRCGRWWSPLAVVSSADQEGVSASAIMWQEEWFCKTQIPPTFHEGQRLPGWRQGLGSVLHTSAPSAAGGRRAGRSRRGHPVLYLVSPVTALFRISAVLGPDP